MTIAHPFGTGLESIVDAGGLDVGRALEGTDDLTLLGMARQGSAVALAVLFARYRAPAERYARHLGLGAEADDVVSESFAQILSLFSRGKGPDSAFRAYLFTSVRHEATRRAKARKKVVATGDADELDRPVPFGNGELDSFERGMVRNAYQALPERWRAVLWELDVEGRSPREVGESQGMSPNAVSALAYRARAGLRESYLTQHVSTRSSSDDCMSARETMAAVVRGTAHDRMRERVLSHLESCDACHRGYEELTEVNRELGVVSAPIVVVAAAGVAAGPAGWVSGALGWMSAVKGNVAAALIPAVAVGAVSVVPVAVEAEVHEHRTTLAAPAVADQTVAVGSAQAPARDVSAPGTLNSRAAGTAPRKPADTASTPARPASPVSVVATTTVTVVAKDVLGPIVKATAPVLTVADDTVTSLLGAVSASGR